MFQSTPTNFMAGDRPPLMTCPDSWMFQSTPTNFMAGDGLLLLSAYLSRMFQSTPTNFMAGDGRRQQSQQCQHLVSIHAHQFHGGRLQYSEIDCYTGQFQSTPTNFMAGDAFHGRPRPQPAACFNPRPPISWRATHDPSVNHGEMHVSIHAHQFHGGRLL